MDNSREGVAEALKRINGITKKQTRIEELEKYKNDFAMKVLLDLTFNPKFEFLLPETDPPYKPLDKANDAQNVLKREVRKMVYFVNLPDGIGLKKAKREEIFIQMLESVDPDDAKLLLAVKNKALPFKRITKEVVSEAMPEVASKW